jgi:glycosyltransferase involved in cell wall biosynthesis
MRIAIVHDWYDRPGGAERVIKSLLEIYPQADLFALVDHFSEANREKYLLGKRVKISFVQSLPFSSTRFRDYLPLFPLAIEQLDLRGYDLVISSSHAVAKGVITHPGQLHISYCYTPMRYIWDMQESYFVDHRIGPLKRKFLRYLFFKLRQWDRLSSERVERFISISSFIQRRVRKYYGRDSVVIHPPVDTAAFGFHADKEDYYFTASRLVPYKKCAMIARTFARNGKRLIIAGDGPDYLEIKRNLTPNITLLGAVSDEKMIYLMQRAKAFVFASFEDFGIVPVEAMSCGTPVIAYGKGGSLDTVVDTKTGIFFQEQSEESLDRALSRFEKSDFDYKSISEHAQRFSDERFKREFADYVRKCISNFDNRGI